MDFQTEENMDLFCVKELRKLIEGESDLDCPRDTKFLVRFVRARKYNVDNAFRNLKLYYGIRIKYPDSFAHLYPSKYRAVLETGVVHVLKHKDELNRQIFVFRVGLWDPSKFSFDEVTMACLLVAEEMSYCQDSHKVGAVVIVDHQGLGMSHAKQLTVGGFRKLLQLFQDCFPARYKAIHLVNQPYMFDVLFSIAKKFMTKKIQRRIHFHTEYKTLQQYIDKENLAESLGGALSDSQAWDEGLMEGLMNREKYYHDQLQYGFKNGKWIK